MGGLAIGADVPLQWDVSVGATGYMIFTSVDGGVTWDSGVDVGNVTTHVIGSVPDNGLILFRVGAYNSQGEAVQYKAGAWYNGSWKPPINPTGLGIQ